MLTICRVASISFRSRCHFARNVERRPAFPIPVFQRTWSISSTGKIYKDTTDNWQPRVGLAYRLSKNTALARFFRNVF